VFAILMASYFFAVSTDDYYINISERVATDHLDSITAARGMRDAVDQIAETAGLSRRESTPLDVARVDAAMAAFDQSLSLQLSRITLPGEKQLTQEIQGSWETVRESATAIRNASEGDRDQIIQSKLMPEVREMRQLFTQLSQMHTQGIKAENDKIQHGSAANFRTLHLILLLGSIAAIGFAMLMGRRMVRPLVAMTVSARAIARGQLDHDLPVKSRDELGELAATFNDMAHELRRFRELDADRLQRAYQTAQTAIDSLPDGVVMIGEDRKVELANKTARRLFGIAAGQEDLRKQLPVYDEGISQQEASTHDYQSSIEVGDNGITRSFLPKSIPLMGDGGRIIGWTVVLVDVTAFRRLDQLKDSLLSMASHELKTPLTSMRMILPLLLEQTIGELNEKQTELVTVTRDSNGAHVAHRGYHSGSGAAVERRRYRWHCIRWGPMTSQRKRRRPWRPHLTPRESN